MQLVYLLGALLCLAIIIALSAGNSLDKKMFKVDRLWKKVWPELLKWVECVTRLSCLCPEPGGGDTERLCELIPQTRKLRQRMELISQLAALTRHLRYAKPSSDEEREALDRLLGCESELLDFADSHETLAGDFNRCLDRPVPALIGRVFGLSPIPMIEF